MPTMMRRICFISVLSVLLLSVPVSACAEEAYFCTEEGCCLKYERRYADDGSLKWTQVLRIDEVDGGQVGYSSSFTNSRGRRMYGGPVKLEASCDSLGNVTVDLARSVAAILENYFSGRAVSWEPCPSVLPALMQPGQVLPDADFTVRVAGLGFRVRVSDRKVLRREDLHTPAGEFDCIVVSEHKVERGLGRNRVTTALTWYARGIGMVRHDTYDKDMVLETSEVLIEIDS